MRIRAFLLLLAVVTSVGVVFVGCQTTRESVRPKVVAIGDSLMALATPNIARNLAAGHEPTIIARNGRRIDEMLPSLRQTLRDEAPVDAVVVNLGTNNLIQAESYDQTLDDFERLIALTEDVPCVVLTTISTRLDTWRETTVGAEINAQIRRLAAKDPRQYQIADWDSAVQAPGGAERLLVEPDGIYDGIHENHGAGRQWFADEYVEALSRCPRLDRP